MIKKQNEDQLKMKIVYVELFTAILHLVAAVVTFLVVM